ncbi:MAG: S8 family serine peptidase [Bacteroidetes bacterium]|nr:S8 family serine peptidase [Bacteroidota bacterium]
MCKTYDFLRKKENVFHGHWHGTATLSCVTGIFEGRPMGFATGAEILLARTECAIKNGRSEEDSWVAAAEWADKNGADIISSSLGYTTDYYFNTEMNGRVSRVSIAATVAAKKGILVINSAGNDGLDRWETVGAPADADSVLSVGGTDPYTDYHINFSSYGPTADGRLKPNVCAPARCAVAKGSGLAEKFGTSFSAPLVAGFAACVWQMHRHLTNMEVFCKIEESSSLYPYFDYAHGFGIPQAQYFFRNTEEEKEPTFDFTVVNHEIKATLREKYTHFGDEKMLGYDSPRNIFLKVENREGKIENYKVMLATEKEIFDAYYTDYSPGDMITIHFEGYTNSITIPESANEEIK